MKKPRGGVIRRGRIVVRQKRQRQMPVYDKKPLHGSSFIRAFIHIRPFCIHINPTGNRFDKIGSKRMRSKETDSARKPLGFLAIDSRYVLERLQINLKIPYMAFIPSATLRR